jgi:hypothetical protein
MQQEKNTRGDRRSTKPNATSKRHGRSSSGDANTTSSTENASRSYRQTMTRDDDDKPQANRRSKKDNTAQSRQTPRSGAPLAKRRSPVGGGKNPTNAKARAPQGSTRRAKQVSGDSKGRTTPNGGAKGSSAKRSRSRK